MTNPTTARPSPLPTSCEARCSRPAGPVESGEARELIVRLTAVVTSFVSPDGRHKALRSIYSPKGVCQMVRGEGHHGLCEEMFDTLEQAADWLEAHPLPEQAALFESGEAV
jgi:hypothetical protein